MINRRQTLSDEVILSFGPIEVPRNSVTNINQTIVDYQAQNMTEKAHSQAKSLFAIYPNSSAIKAFEYFTGLAAQYATTGNYLKAMQVSFAATLIMKTDLLEKGES